MAKVSIIIPVYNALPYLHECLESIQNQTYTGWEVIAVDDCSTDESYNELLKYAKKDSRIKVFQMEQNSGSGPARNMAVDNASGDYILFMDPDDLYPANDVVEKLYNKIVGEGLNLAGGNVIRFDAIQTFNKKVDTPFHKEEVIKSEVYNSSLGYWRFIFSAKVIREHNIRFPSYRRRQDPVFFAEYLGYVDKIATLPITSYAYRNAHKVLKLDKEKVTSILISYQHCLDLFKQNNQLIRFVREQKGMLNFLENKSLPYVLFEAKNKREILSIIVKIRYAGYSKIILLMLKVYLKAVPGLRKLIRVIKR